MKATLPATLTLLAAAVVVVSLQSADAHYAVPRYNGISWGVACLAPSGGVRQVPPAACCNHARSYCETACSLAEADNGWKNACRANCQAAGAACLQRVTPRPREGIDPRTQPPATPN